MRFSKCCVTILAAVVCVLAASSAEAATVYAFWSFDTQLDGTGSVDSNVTAETFPGTPSRTRTGTTTVTNSVGGEASYTDFQGNTWLGSGTLNTPGHSLGWNAGSTGNSMTHFFSMQSLTDLHIRMAIRSATNSPPPLSSFSAIDYSLDSGGTWLTAASGSALDFTIGSNAFHEYLLDLSALDAIEGQSDVQLRFIFDTVPSSTSFRVDNIEFSATIPEPATALLISLAFAGGILRRPTRCRG